MLKAVISDDKVVYDYKRRVMECHVKTEVRRQMKPCDYISSGAC